MMRVMDDPLVSCVMATYNFERFVERSIDSILAQEYPRDRIELIVVDDGSQDRTPELVEPYLDRITYIRKPNGGLLSTINRGLGECHGELIALASGDDEWKPDCVARHVEVLRRRPEVGLVYGDLEVVDDDGNVVDPSFLAGQDDRRRGRVFGRLLVSNYISGGGTMFRASFLDRIHPIPDWAPYEDWWIALRVAEVAEVEELPPPAIYRYRRHGANRSLDAGRERMLRLLESELPLRRWLLRRLAPGTAAATDVIAAVECLLQYVRAVAADRALTPAELLELSPEDLEHAEPAADAAASLLATGDLDGAVALAANAIGHVPLHERALTVLSTVSARCQAARDAVAEAPSDVRGVALVALATEVAADDRLLAAYAQAFSADDDVTLVIYAPDWTPQRAESELGAAAAAAGLDSAGAADLLAHVVPRSDRTEQLLSSTAKALLSERPQPGPLSALPRTGADGVGALRSHLTQRDPTSATSR
jgi:hypothetical protein